MSGKVTIYTDGSSRGNPGPGGYGVVMMAAGARKEMSGGFKRTTNNRMELMGVITGLEALRKVCEVVVISDSKYVIDAMAKGWIHGWRQKAWSRGPNKPLKNADLWRRLAAASAGHSVEWKWVRGHAGNVFNERCDVLAVSAGRGAGLPVDVGYAGD